MTRQRRRTKAHTMAIVAVSTVLALLGFADGFAQEDMVASAGVYTAEQADRGKAAYDYDCAACHLDDLLGDGFSPPLVGEPFNFRWNALSVDDIYQSLFATMPQGAPASLTPQGYIDIIAYMLQRNEYPAGDTELPTDSDALKEIIIDARP